MIDLFDLISEQQNIRLESIDDLTVALQFVNAKGYSSVITLNSNHQEILLDNITRLREALLC